MSCEPDVSADRLGRNKAAIDHDLLPAGQTCRTEHEIARAFGIVADRRAAAVRPARRPLLEIRPRNRTRVNSELSCVIPGHSEGGGSAIGASL